MKMHRLVPPAVALTSSLLLAGQAHAWEPECKDGKCAMSVVASQTANGKPLLKLSVLFNEDGSNPSLILQTPLGSALDSGARLKIDMLELKLVYKVCYPDGCQAYTKLEAADWDALRKAKGGLVQFFEQNGGKLLSAAVDLSGIDEALAKVVKK